VAVYAGWSVVRRFLPAEIEYRGEKIRLSKFYLDYDDYKNDPHNIHPDEIERVKKMVAEAPIARSFPNIEKLLWALSDIQFPGYGSGQFGERVQADGSVIAGHIIEIPCAGKDRILVFKKKENRYILIDDFIAESDLWIMDVQEINGKLIYTTLEGKKVLEREIDTKDL
jgi:hypothetical protein